MATNDELGITHPGLGDSASLSAILDTLIAQIKPLLVARFASAAARTIAYPNNVDAPWLNMVNGTLQTYGPVTDTFAPVCAAPFGQTVKNTSDVVPTGTAGQVGCTWTGPAGFYLVLGSMAIGNNVNTDPLQLVSRELRFDGGSSGTAPFTIAPVPEITHISHSSVFTANAQGAHGAQMICTPQAAPAKIYAGSSINVIYLGGGLG